MLNVLVVGLGGFIGASLRYLTGVAFMRFLTVQGHFATLFVNVIGGFLIGLILEAANGMWQLSPQMRLFLTTGILGGLTTFSTFSYETIKLLDNGSYFEGILNIALNIMLSLGACWLGRIMVQAIWQG